MVGVDDKNHEHLRRLGLARVAAGRVDRAGRLSKVLARVIDPGFPVIHLRLDRA